MATSKSLGWGTAALALSALTFAPSLTPQAAEQPGEGKTVRPARATWDTGWFQAEVYNQALRKLGYQVEATKTLDNPIFYQGVADGDVDFWVNGWFPQHREYEEHFEGGAEIIGHVAKGGALQGYMIDKRTAEEHGITNLGDLEDPEIAALFDADGDGDADMAACPPSWYCSQIIDHQLEAYGLADIVDRSTATYPAAMADALARFENGEPVLFYTWTPSWVIGTLEPGEDVVWIEVPHPSLPDEQAQYEDLTTVEGVEGCVNDPCAMGWPGNDIQPVANREFLEENPAVRKLFEVASIPLEDIAAQNARMFEGEDSEEELQRHAEEWIEANREQFDAWLEEARGAAS